MFTRLMKPVVGFLRKRGIRLVLYLDDMLIIGSTPQETRLFTQMAMNLLESLGFIINKEKSVLTPTRIIGFTINSITMLFILPSKKNNPKNDLYIITYHVPGKTNVVADRESREFWNNSDWMLDPIIIRPFLMKGYILHGSVRLATYPSTDDLHQYSA